MPKIIVGLFAALFAMLCWGGDANAATVFSGACYNTTARHAKYYYVNYSGNLGNAYSSDEEVDISTYSSGTCTAGTQYIIQASTNGQTIDYGNMETSLARIYSCTACADGYELATSNGPFIYGNTDKIQCNSLLNLTVQVCVKKNDGGGGTTCTSSNCVSSDWVTYNNAYIKRTARSCTNSTTCTSTIQYGCNYGYYKTSGSSAYLTSASGCSKCPPYNVNGTSYATTTAMRDAINVQSCVVDAVGGVTEFQDASGTFVMAAPYGMEATPPKYCMFSLGNCAGYTAVCSTISGTTYAVVSGTKANSTSGTYCWCNANGKSFMVANMNSYSTCAQNCKGGCQAAFVGHSGNNYNPMISYTALGC